MVYRLIILQLALLIVTATTYADDYEYVDSILELTQLSTGTPKQVDLYNELAAFYYEYNNKIKKDSTLVYLQMALEAAEKIDYKKGLAETNYSFGKYYLGVSGNLPKATPYLLKGLDLFLKLEEKNGISKSYMQLGLISYLLHYYEGAVEKLLLSLEADNNPTSQYLLAITYSGLDSSDLAKESFYKSITDFKKLQKSNSLNDCYMWLGRLHLKTGQLDSSFYYLNKSIEFAKSKN